MNIAGINKESIVDGPGMRVTIFVSGCFHNCPGCHNPEAQNFKFGEPLTDAIFKDILDSLHNPMVSGITFSGGDPMYSAKEVLDMIHMIKLSIPNINIWVYTGFTWEEIMNGSDYWMKMLLDEIDVLVDGRFIEELKDYSQSFRGSTNQRFIDCKKSLQYGEVIEYIEEEF